MSEHDNAKLQHDKEVAFYSVAVQAWIETRMEKDRTILTLSAGGIGLLATLLTTVGPSSHCQLVLYLAAGLSFVAAIFCAVRVFDKNADHLRDVVAKGHDGESAELIRLDLLLFCFFLLGVVLTGTIAISAGLSHLGAKL